MIRAGRLPFPLLDELPDALRGVILDFHWNLEHLHALDLPDRTMRTMATYDLAWHLELPFWADRGQPFQVSPAEVRAYPDRYAEQWSRTMTCDLAYPLDCYLDPHGRVTVLDGVHRLLKADVLGWRTVSIHILRESDLDAIAVPLKRLC